MMMAATIQAEILEIWDVDVSDDIVASLEEAATDQYSCGSAEQATILHK